MHAPRRSKSVEVFSCCILRVHVHLYLPVRIYTCTTGCHHISIHVCHLAVTKQRDADTGQHSLFFQIDYPEIAEGVRPRHRFMSAYEQRVEPPDRSWQYLLFAAEPYETIAFKVSGEGWGTPGTI